MYLSYQSMEDWTEVTDVVRCNANFHEHPRYDSVVINSERRPRTPLHCARLYGLYRCYLPSHDHVDVALVHEFRSSRSWRPRTVWKGCSIYEQSSGVSFVLVENLFPQTAHVESVAVLRLEE